MSKLWAAWEYDPKTGALLGIEPVEVFPSQREAVEFATVDSAQYIAVIEIEDRPN